MRIHTRAAIAAAAIAAALPAAAATSQGFAPNYTFADGSKGFAFTTTGGFVDPEVLVDFNPQPDPPGFGASRDLSPGGSRFTQIFTPAGDAGYGFLIALLDIGPDARLPLPPSPNSDGDTGAQFLGDGSVFRISLAFAGPGDTLDWAAFNPQPDPPGIWFGAQYDYGAPGDPLAGFGISENETPLALTLASVPEPSAWALMILGMGGIGAALRARGRRPAARIVAPV